MFQGFGEEWKDRSVVQDVGGVMGRFLEERLDSGSLEGSWKQASIEGGVD